MAQLRRMGLAIAVGVGCRPGGETAGGSTAATETTDVGETTELSTSSGTGSESSATTDAPGSDGTSAGSAVFSELPPYDVVGARWQITQHIDGQQTPNVYEVVDTFTWPDGSAGSTV